MVEQIGKYEVSELIGHGGMADVYKVTNKGVSGFSKTLCIKRIRKEYVDRPEFVEMFETEARIVSHLQHDNIVQVYDFGRDENTRELFLVMEYIDGLDLNTILEIVGNYGTVSINFAVYVLESLLLALDHAHTLEVDGKRSSVIHRDISPHNILLSSAGSVKLADFGIAKAKGLSLSDETRTGVLKGKLSYMSPEQASAGKMPITPVSDLFSAGVVFWETITSKQLFNATMEHLALGAMKLDESLLSDRSERLRKFVTGMLAPDPVNRFSSAEAALRALHRIGIRPCTKSDAAHLVRKCKHDIDQETWIAEHRFDADGKGSLEGPQGTALTQRDKRSWAQTDGQETDSVEYTATRSETCIDDETSSTVVERPDISPARRRLSHLAVIVAATSSVILVILTLFWFLFKSEDDASPQAHRLDNESAGMSEPAARQNTALQEKSLTPFQREQVEPVVSVHADKNDLDAPKDTEPVADESTLPDPKKEDALPPNGVTVKNETPNPDGEEASAPQKTVHRKKHNQTKKTGKDKGGLGALIKEQFPLDVTN